MACRRIVKLRRVMPSQQLLSEMGKFNEELVLELFEDVVT
jgi:hypothetical protein